jgi:transaldolase
MIEEGLRLNAAGGPDSNVMIKAPAVPEGFVAMEELTYKGVSINATVSFSVAQAVKAAEAVERGLKRRESEGKEGNVGKER